MNPSIPASRRPYFSSDVVFALSVSVAWALFYNLRFWQQALTALWQPSASWLLFVSSLFLLVVFVQALPLLLMPGRTAMRVAASVLFVIASVGAYFADSYGIVMNRDMMRNVFQTDLSEAGDLLTFGLVSYVLLLGILPAVLLWRVRLPHVTLKRAVSQRLVAVGTGLVLCLGTALASSASYAVFLREHKPVRSLLSPASIVSSTVGYAAAANRRPVLRLDPGGTPGRTAPARAGTMPAAARQGKPLLLFLVVGETARAANFELNGYARPTNPELKGKAGLVYFSNTASCGTSTAASLPCMFSHRGRESFHDLDSRRFTNLVDMLQKAQVAVEWRDNNSGCKGVCERVPTIDYFSKPPTGLAAWCAHSHCYDEVMNAGLEDRLAGIDRDTVIVFHQNGSHGPAYFERYPPSFEYFKPACRVNQLDKCSQQEVINAYDNSIRYTDHVLAQQIAILEKYGDRVDAALVYVSDHGESLGEQGIYLHGMPYSFAPKVQKEVPFLLWTSTGYRQRSGVSTGCFEAANEARLSHDNLFHTVFGLLGVRNAVYDQSLDLSASCRNAAAGSSIVARK